MLVKKAMQYRIPILFLILATTVVFGSKYMGDYSSISYILIGALVYLMIKILSDFRAANKTIYIGFEQFDMPARKGTSESDAKEEKPIKEQQFFRLLYDAALMEGAFIFTEDKSELFRRNNAVIRITKDSLIRAAKSGKRLTVLRRDAEAMKLDHSQVGGLLLFLQLSGRLRYLDERNV
ncbi:MAG: hypothetical protein LVQ95_00120 [Candidatus Micrarchaeales archaeon]|nr:hypothetical protein [Candidatus Micrarchaeales archaeon]